MCDLADLRFGHGAERRQSAAQLRLAQAEQEIGLIFPRIHTLAQHSIAVAGVGESGRSGFNGRIDAAGLIDPSYNMVNDRVMAGSDIIAAERLCLLPKIAELEFLVAHHTWVRCPAGP